MAGFFLEVMSSRTGQKLNLKKLNTATKLWLNIQDYFNKNNMYTNINQEKEFIKMNLLHFLKQTRMEGSYFTLREIANVLLEAYSDEIPLLIKEFTSDEIN